MIFENQLRLLILEQAASVSSTLQNAMLDAVLNGGKRLRPRLSQSIAADTNIADSIWVPIAAAVELIHAFSLVHDDLPELDNDDWRRGNLTTHRKFGHAQALLAGDALLASACGVFVKAAAGCNGQAFQKSFTFFLENVGARGLIGGQALELEAPHSAVTEFTKKVNQLKTGCLFQAAIVCPVIAAGKDLGWPTDRLVQLGSALGEIYQYQDDLSDLEQDSTKIRPLLPQDATDYVSDFLKSWTNDYGAGSQFAATVIQLTKTKP